MYIKRKNRVRLALLAAVVLIIIFTRGLSATTKTNFTCEYKLIYAVCTPKKGTPKLPGLIDIIKAGVKF